MNACLCLFGAVVRMLQAVWRRWMNRQRPSLSCPSGERGLATERAWSMVRYVLCLVRYKPLMKILGKNHIIFCVFFFFLFRVTYEWPITHGEAFGRLRKCHYSHEQWTRNYQLLWFRWWWHHEQVRSTGINKEWRMLHFLKTDTNEFVQLSNACVSALGLPDAEVIFSVQV